MPRRVRSVVYAQPRVVVGKRPTAKFVGDDGTATRYAFAVVMVNDGKQMNGETNDGFGDVAQDWNTSSEVFWPTSETWQWWHNRLRKGTAWEGVEDSYAEFKASVAARWNKDKQEAAVKQFADKLVAIRAVLDMQRSWLRQFDKNKGTWSASQRELQRQFNHLHARYYGLAEGFYGNAYPVDDAGNVIVSGDLGVALQGPVIAQHGWGASPASRAVLSSEFGGAWTAPLIVGVVAGIAITALAAAWAISNMSEVLIAWEQSSLNREYMRKQDKQWSAAVAFREREAVRNEGLIRDGLDPLPAANLPDLVSKPDTLHAPSDEGRIVLVAGAVVAGIAGLALWNQRK